ncbi:diacylglycerol/lipid kinase family protein [Staphylococcus auricularis]|uniref:diacylglycerol/lipid kinase family protein n=1 Tax=Staphylococcus auricularis TaxID=29379 RepID=UPI003EB7874C
MSQQYQHGVLFYHNHSGINDIHQGLGDVTKALTQLCKHVSIQLSESEGDIIDYCASIKAKRYSDDVDVLFILGGDGTVNELINGVMQHDLNLPIGIIPGGTFNDFTKTLNLSPKHDEASQQLLQARPTTYDVIKVNDTYALNFVGLCLIVQNAKNVQAGNKDLFGKLSYIGSTMKTLIHPTSFDYELTVDGETWTGSTAMIIIANGPFIGGSRIPMTDLNPSDGYLDMFVFKKKDFSILNDIFKQRDSINWNHMTKGIKHALAQKISLSTNQSMDVDIDGEIALSTPLDIEVIPRAVELLTLPAEDTSK